MSGLRARPMRTPPAQAQAIEASLALAGERAGDLTQRVYAKLFRREPAMEELFWRDKNGAIKGEMLMRVFEAILDFIGERHFADHLIESEVLNHEGYDVPRSVFATFFGIVAESVREACGEDWTAAMDEAWRAILVELDACVAHPEDAAA